MTNPKPSAEYTAFDSLVRQVLAVPREELKRREAEYRKASAAKPNRPGPKRGSKRQPKAK